MLDLNENNLFSEKTIDNLPQHIVKSIRASPQAFEEYNKLRLECIYYQLILKV